MVHRIGSILLAVSTATSSGTLMVVAAGSEHAWAQQLVVAGRGHEYGTELRCPGQARAALTVGSQIKFTHAPAATSSTGPPTYELGHKPDLVAPGEQVMSTIPMHRDASGNADPNALRSLMSGAKVRHVDGDTGGGWSMRSDHPRLVRPWQAH